MPAIAYVGDVDGKPVGWGGVAWHMGKCWIWIEVHDRAALAGRGLAVVRMARFMLRVAGRYGEPAVYAARDVTEPGSDKLLKLIGFTKVDDHGVTLEDGSSAELWEWRISQQSPQSSVSLAA